MKSPNKLKMPKIKTQRMTIDKLALLMQQEFLHINQRFNELDDRLDSLEKRMDAIEKRIDAIEERLCVVERKISELKISFADLQADNKIEFRSFDRRITILEQKVGV
ncbi:MAG: hypothetical protein WC285_02660 [Candidatus Gracilibacteria bacterium]|jgi:predicted  nucleic acid-binding Zn-ribbon protein